MTGKRVASARRDVHLSQRALAAHLGVSLRTVQNYEAGRSIPYRHLDGLSRLLARSPSWLLYGHEQPVADQLLARARKQRVELERNLQRLLQLRDELVTTAGQPRLKMGA